MQLQDELINTAPIEFPLLVSVVANTVSENVSEDPTISGDVVMGGDIGW